MRLEHFIGLAVGDKFLKESYDTLTDAEKARVAADLMSRDCCLFLHDDHEDVTLEVCRVHSDGILDWNHEFEPEPAEEDAVEFDNPLPEPDTFWHNAEVHFKDERLRHCGLVYLTVMADEDDDAQQMAMEFLEDFHKLMDAHDIEEQDRRIHERLSVKRESDEA